MPGFVPVFCERPKKVLPRDLAVPHCRRDAAARVSHLLGSYPLADEPTILMLGEANNLSV